MRAWRPLARSARLMGFFTRVTSNFPSSSTTWSLLGGRMPPMDRALLTMPK